MAWAQDRGQGRMARGRVGDRFEPALDAAIERVIVAALVVRLMRLPGDPGWRGAKDPEPATAVAAAIGHVGVDPKIAPGRGKTLPIGKASLFQQPPHFRRTHKGKAVTLDCLSKRGEQFCHWRILEPAGTRPLRPRPAAAPVSLRPAPMCRPRAPLRSPFQLR